MNISYYIIKRSKANLSKQATLQYVHPVLREESESLKEPYSRG